MAVGVLGFLVFVLALPALALLVWSLYTILTTPQPSWDAAEMNQLVWVLVVLFMPLFGSILFVVIARPRLRELEAVAGSGF